VVTPESGPVGFEKVRGALRAGSLSPRMASTASEKQAMPAERIAAAPEPLGIAGVLGIDMCSD
jgi:hypothetical protein